MSKIGAFFTSLKGGMVTHSPEILTGLGIAGFFTTVVLAVRATPKAMENIKKDKAKTKKEVVKSTWKCYIPAAITGAASTACIIGGQKINLRRNAALATALSLSETAFKEYKEEVIETIGEKKEKEVKDNLAKKKVEEHPVNDSEIIDTGKGTTLFFDALCGRYFYHDIEKVNRIENLINKRLYSEMYISVNEVYGELSLEPMDPIVGDMLGWNVNNGDQFEFSYSSTLDRRGRPCRVMSFGNPPSYDYRSVYNARKLHSL